MLRKLFLFGWILLIANPVTESRLNRRPGILEPPSDVPTGENAALYLNLLKDKKR